MRRTLTLGSLSGPNFALLLGLAWLAVALRLLLQDWAATGETFTDADDAMRLVQVRAFLAGQGWFDLHEARIAPPGGYDTHWSRLVDVGLAGPLLLFNLFTDQAFSERLLRAVWPLLWIPGVIGGIGTVAWRLAGPPAAVVALLLAAVGEPAYQQFSPGRIDHHNVQITLSLLVVAASVWSDRRPWCAWAAGALTGLALAVGLESLPYVAACGAIFCLRFINDPGQAAALRAYGLALAASTVVAFLVGVDPGHWTRTGCDAIALNTAAAVAAGGLLLAAAGLAHPRAGIRAAAMGLAASGTLAVFVVLEPRCLGGPYALVDPAVWPLWLGEVREAQPLMRVWQSMPLTAVAIAAFPLAALVAAAGLARNAGRRRDFAFLLATAALLLACVTTAVEIRAYSYAMWLGMPLIAAGAAQLFAALRVDNVPARLVAALLITPTGLTAGAITLANAAGLHDNDSFIQPETQSCFRMASYAPLARLPTGLAVTDVRFGPYLLALTPHAVLSAPYHRLSTAIVAAQRALAAPPDRARALLAEAGADYVMMCGTRPPPGLRESDRGGSLWGQLQAGVVPGWLEPIAETRGQAFAAYRIKR
jgi:hypothetical protein